MAAIRVRLVKTLDPVLLPVGIMGTKINKGGVNADGSLANGLHVIAWDWKATIPMYSHEIEVIQPSPKEPPCPTIATPIR